jgi:S-adenosylmethionine decarboxylase
METKGLHVVADVWFAEMPQQSKLQALVQQALVASKMTVLDEVTHVFGPGAFTYAALLGESHFTVHTYPERLYAAMDIYTCGSEGDPVVAIQTVLSGCLLADSQVRVLARG